MGSQDLETSSLVIYVSLASGISIISPSSCRVHVARMKSCSPNAGVIAKIPVSIVQVNYIATPFGGGFRSVLAGFSHLGLAKGVLSRVSGQFVSK